MSARIRVRVTPAVAEDLSAAAEAVGMSRPQYLTALLWNDQLKRPPWRADPASATHLVELYPTDEEAGLIAAAAAAHGLSVSDYCRQRWWPRPAPPKRRRTRQGALVQRVTETHEVDRRDTVIEIAIVDLLADHPDGLSASRIVEEVGCPDAAGIMALGALVGDGTLVLSGERYKLGTASMSG
ncbi:MAG: hypothetical protein MOGMAGMI_02490 [Candidatus Omnitrophica bacterium]|nr:hypothetical protein [Candidatus Omnitrophota bacterium]